VSAPRRPRVLVTRPAAQAAVWVERLRATGIDAEALPLIAIVAVADRRGLQAAWAGLAARRLVVFVSSNAVVHFFAGRPPDLVWPAGVVAAAPGPGTAEALRDVGVAEAAIVAPASDAPQLDSESLWARLQGRDWRGASVLIVSGDGGRDWLAERLREAGATVESLPAYRREAPDFAGSEAQRLTQARRQRRRLALQQRRGDRESRACHRQRPLRALARGRHPPAHRRAGASGRLRPRRRGRAALRCRGRLHTIDRTVNDDPSLASAPRDVAVPPTSAVPPAAPTTPPAPGTTAGGAAWSGRGPALAVMLLALLAIVALFFAWRADQRVRSSERELVQRQQESALLVTESTRLCAPGHGRRARRRRKGRSPRSALNGSRCSAAGSRRWSVGGALARRPAWSPTAGRRCAPACSRPRFRQRRAVVAALEADRDRASPPTSRASSRSAARCARPRSGQGRQRRRCRDALDKLEEAVRMTTAAGVSRADLRRRDPARARSLPPRRRPSRRHRATGSAAGLDRTGHAGRFLLESVGRDPLAGSHHADRSSRGDAGRP
jgi:uroporphyrinogen-III synthase